MGSSPVSGGAIPWRYCSDRYANETLEMGTRNYSHWFHLRLRFFVGGENKLPIDMHAMVALIAPRGYMITLGINEGEVNAWGEERGFLPARRVYEFLGAKDRITIRLRPGTHRTPGSNIEEYFEWYDTVLGRRKFSIPDRLLWNYSFEKWKSISGEGINPASFPANASCNAGSGLSLDATSVASVRSNNDLTSSQLVSQVGSLSTRAISRVSILRIARKAVKRGFRNQVRGYGQRESPP